MEFIREVLIVVSLRIEFDSSSFPRRRRSKILATFFLPRIESMLNSSLSTVPFRSVPIFFSTCSRQIFCSSPIRAKDTSNRSIYIARGWVRNRWSVELARRRRNFWVRKFSASSASIRCNGGSVDDRNGWDSVGPVTSGAGHFR